MTTDSYGYILIIDSRYKGWTIIYKITKNKNMPGFNGTGPLGFGPGTGWGWGPCGAGMGWRSGRGRGRGFGRGGRFWGYGPWNYGPYQPKITKKEEIEMLTDEAELLEEELKAIKERLTELKVKK